MVRRVFFAAVFMTGSAVLFAAQNATFVLKGGERVSGLLSYDGGYNLLLNVNGQDRRFPWADVAIIALVSGDPSAAELGQTPESDSAPELERHLIVMRDGSVVRGKLYNISRDGGIITIDTQARERRDISSNSIARIYLEGGSARSVYKNLLDAPATPGPGRTTSQPPAPAPPPVTTAPATPPAAPAAGRGQRPPR